MRLFVGPTRTSMKPRSNGATSASKAADSHSAENGQPQKRFVQHQAGHSNRCVVTSILATTADWLGSYAHPAVAGLCGQAGAVPSVPDLDLRRHIGTGVARLLKGTHTPPEKKPPRLWTAAGGSRISIQGAPSDVRSGGKWRPGTAPARPGGRQAGAGRVSFVTGAER
jgi:hypothetical protein